MVRPERRERTMSATTFGFASRVLASAATIAAVGCASAGGSGSQGTSTISVLPTTSPTNTGQARTAWRLATLEHVDLWLHGFALLTSDTGHVPFFERGYKQQVTALKRQRNVFSQLDANQQDLSARFAARAALANA